MKKIIVFGATGEVGRYFVLHCMEKKEFEIIAVGRKKELGYEAEGVKYYSLDIAEKEEFSKLPIENIHAVVNCAGLMPARMEKYSPIEYFNINTIGTLNILEFCRENKIDKILYTQTFSDIKDNAEEDIILRVNSPRVYNYDTDHTEYAISKIAAVELIKTYQAKFGISGYIFRLPQINMYTYDDSYYKDGIKRKIGLRVLIDNVIEGKPVEVFGDATRVKDMIYIKDLCEMMYLGLVKESKEYYEFNVGTGKGVSLDDLVKGIIKVFGEGKDIPISYASDKPNTPQYIMDITEAEVYLGYKPQYGLIEMLEDYKAEMFKNERKV